MGGKVDRSEKVSLSSTTQNCETCLNCQTRYDCWRARSLSLSRLLRRTRSSIASSVLCRVETGRVRRAPPSTYYRYVFVTRIKTAPTNAGFLRESTYCFPVVPGNGAKTPPCFFPSGGDASGFLSPAEGGEWGTLYHAWPQSYDRRPWHPYNAGTEHVGFSLTRKTLIACIKREAP